MFWCSLRKEKKSFVIANVPIKNEIDQSKIAEFGVSVFRRKWNSFFDDSPDCIFLHWIATAYLYWILIIRFLKLNTFTHANARRFHSLKTIKKSDSGTMQDRIQIIWTLSKKQIRYNRVNAMYRDQNWSGNVWKKLAVQFDCIIIKVRTCLIY